MFLRLIIAFIALSGMLCAELALAAIDKQTVSSPGSNAETITPAPIVEDDNPQTSNTAVLQGLNKVTGHTSRLEGPIGTTLRFGNLEIIPRRCWKSAPEDRPENAILLEIRELHAGEESKRIFLGWMFSSSPGLSGLEHPVYDINVLACEYRADPEKNAISPTKTDNTTPEATTPAVKKPSLKHKKPVNQ